MLLYCGSLQVTTKPLSITINYVYYRKIGYKYVFYIPRVREFYGQRKEGRVETSDQNCDPVCTEWTQRAQIHDLRGAYNNRSFVR